MLPVLYMLFDKFEKNKTFSSKNFLNHNKRKHKVISISTFIFLGASFLKLNAQEKSISLQHAIELALKQNLSVRASRLQTESLQKSENSAWDIPFTAAQGEYGQINSIANDTRFTVTQSVAFPRCIKDSTIFIRHKQKAAF
ncbi:MAG: hypothetical protein WKG06_37590 [Segetibacter sp.]